MKITHLEGYTRQSCPALIYLSQGLTPSIFTVVSPWYFPSCFPLAFLEGCCTSLSPVATSLRLDPITWDPSAPSNRAVSSSSTLSWSYWIYSNFFFSFAILCFLASFLALASTSLLAF